MTTAIAQKYTWREYWVFPYESLWSLLNKFGKLNWVSGLEIKNLFRVRNEPKKRHAEYDELGLWNFHAAKGFDVEKIGHTLHLFKRQITEGITAALISKRELTWLMEAKRLRYCSKCISVGYHSVFHQFTDVKVCPIHNVELTERCHHCKRNIPYELQNDKHLFGCSFCKRSLLSVNANDSYESEWFLEIMSSKKKLDEIFDWFVSLNRVFLYPEIDRKCFEKANEVMDYWGEMIHKKKPECFTALRKSGANHRSEVLTTEFRDNVVRLKKDYSNNRYFNQRELRCVYKSIRRYIVKSFKMNRIKCHSKVDIPWLLGGKCWLRDAFKAWRLHWEKETGAIKVLWIESVLNADLGKAALNKKAATRIFALECYWSFEDCITNYNTMDHEWRSRIYTKYPFWTIEKDDARLIFHSWTEKSVLNNLVKGQCPACMCNPSVEALVA